MRLAWLFALLGLTSTALAAAIAQPEPGLYFLWNRHVR